MVDLMTREDRVQIALGLKALCEACKTAMIVRKPYKSEYCLWPELCRPCASMRLTGKPISKLKVSENI